MSDKWDIRGMSRNARVYQGGRRACHTTVLLQHQEEQRSPQEVVEADEAEVLSSR